VRGAKAPRYRFTTTPFPPRAKKRSAVAILGHRAAGKNARRANRYERRMQRGVPAGRRAKWRLTLPFYFVENLWIIVCVYVSPGRRTTGGKSGLFGESG